MTDLLLSSVLRLREKAKNVAKTQVRNPYRRRKKAIKLTQDERHAKQAARDAKKISFTSALEGVRKTIMDGAANLAEQFPEHDKDYYYRLIMQRPATKTKRGISKWCAFLSMGMEKHNEKLAAERGEDAHRDRVTNSNALQEISEAWAALSSEQKTAVTADKVKELEERRENRLQAVHNTNIAACHDARATLKNIHTELENLNKRMGIATLLVTTRGTIEACGDPAAHYTDSRVPRFMESVVGLTLEDLALRMEGYCVSGVQGVVSNQQERTQLQRNLLGSLITAKLQDTSRRANRGEVKRMNYVNFADAITRKHGIVAENWTTRFENTSALSGLEVEVALRAWQSGTTRFRALTDEEWRAWLEGRYNPQATLSTPATDADDPSSPNSVHSPAVANSEVDPSATNALPVENAPPTENTPSPSAENASLAENAQPTIPANQSAGAMVPEKRSGTSTKADVAAPAAKRVRAGPMAISFINSATPAAGESFSIPKAARKKRSDAGVPRGPRKKPAAGTSENVPPATSTAATSATTTPAATPSAAKPSKSRARRGKQPAAADSTTTATV